MMTPQRGMMMFLAGLLLVVRAAEAKPRSKDHGQAKEKQAKEKQAAGLVKAGKVRVVRGIKGASPMLTDDSNHDWFLAGTLRPELMRLSGHRIKVWATAGKKKLATPVLVVKRYEILDSGGRKPLVGILQQDESQDLLLQQERGTIKITGRPAFLKRLARRVDCRIWIVGTMEGKVLNAYKFGWLRCEKKKQFNQKKENKK